MRQNRRTLSLVRRPAFGRQAAGSKQCQEPRMFWRPERGEVKFDSGSQERLGAGVYVRRRLEPVRERVHCRIGVRLGGAPSPRPSAGGRGSKIGVTPRWEWVHRTGGRLGGGPSPRPSPGGRGSRIGGTPRWEWEHRIGGRLGGARSPRPSPGGRGSKIVVTPGWELRLCGDGDFLKLLSLTIIYYHFFGQLFVMRSHISNLALQPRFFALPRLSRVRRPAWPRAENREWGETGSF